MLEILLDLPRPGSSAAVDAFAESVGRLIELNNDRASYLISSSSLRDFRSAALRRNRLVTHQPELGRVKMLRVWLRPLADSADSELRQAHLLTKLRRWLVDSGREEWTGSVSAWRAITLSAPVVRDIFACYSQGQLGRLFVNASKIPNSGVVLVRADTKRGNTYRIEIATPTTPVESSEPESATLSEPALCVQE